MSEELAMKQNKRVRSGQIWSFVLFLLLVSKFVPFGDVLAQGGLVDVKVTIEQSHFNDCYDTVGTPDIYFRVSIDGVEQNDKNDPIRPNTGPFSVGREYKQPVDASKRNIRISIGQWDDDPGDDQHCNLKPGPGRTLYLNLDLATCEISGDAEGICAVPIHHEYTGIYFRFKIEYEGPTHTEDLSVRCLHHPIWPQPGDEVTITAEALDGNGNLKQEIIDDIQIFVDDSIAPIANSASTSFGVNTFSFKYTPAAGAKQILYGCRILDDGSKTVDTGWRIVVIGFPQFYPSWPSWLTSVPILNTGTMRNSIDIVFIADEDDYSGPDDPDFIDDVHDVIRDAYYRGINHRIFLFNQDLMNFWIALGQGNATSLDSHESHEPPDGWLDRYQWADAGVILHTEIFSGEYHSRGMRIISGRSFQPIIILHETGHMPFGLSDEQCNDDIPYFQPTPRPNIYNDQDDCLNDPLATGVSDACQQISEGDCTVDWYRLDSASTRLDDLMTGYGENTPRPADERRINWLFEECSKPGGC
jgi:hypothetical protein